MTRLAALLAAAALAAVVAVSLPATAGAAGSQSFSDPAGDANGAPDIETVVVSNDDAGMIRIAVSTPSRPTLNADDVVMTLVETTALKGVLALYVGGGFTRVCMPAAESESACAPSTVPVSAVFANGTTTFTVDANALGARDEVFVTVATFSGLAEDTGREDVGPMIDYRIQETPDTVAPHAKALAAGAVHGRPVKLGYRAWDDSGATREELSVYRGTKRLWRTSTMLGPSKQGELRSQTWTVPRSVHGTLRFSVQAWDEAGNASPVSWATVTVR